LCLAPAVQTVALAIQCIVEVALAALLGSGLTGLQAQLATAYMQQQSTEKRRRYWRKNLRVTALLLLLWFAVTFGVSYFARFLNFSFFGWPFSFWMGAQGSLLVYGLIIGFYAWYMNRLDAEHGEANEDD